MQIKSTPAEIEFVRIRNQPKYRLSQKLELVDECKISQNIESVRKKNKLKYRIPLKAVEFYF